MAPQNRKNLRMMRLRRASWLAGVTLVVVSPMVGSAAASAASSAATATKIATTATLGGYAVTGKGTASVTFAVPKVTCPKTSIGTVSLGVAAADIGGNSAEAVISVTCQVPRPPVMVAEVISYCSGHATKTKAFPVVAGNKIVTTASPTGAATVDDVSRNATTTVTGCAIKMKKAIFGLFCPFDWTIPYPPPSGTPACQMSPGISRLTFAGASLGSKPVKSSASTPFEMVAGKSKVIPGKLSTKGNFTVTAK